VLDPKGIVRLAPIPAVDPDDLARVWALMSQHREPPTGVSVEVYARECHTEGTDPMAVPVRAMLAETLLRQGFTASAGFFRRVAMFPLPGGLQAFDYDVFAAKPNEE
jgi:hypothetical protein